MFGEICQWRRSGVLDRLVTNGRAVARPRAGIVRRAGVACAAVALLGVAFGGGVASAGAATLVVDRDGEQCKNADYSSISAAVAAADPGDRIKVCPDLYTEPVTVNKPGLRLTAKRAGARQCLDATPAPADPTRQAIVTAPGGRAFDLQADNVTLSGFVVQGSTQGIRTGQGFSGYRVRRNIVQRNTLGALFGGSGEYLSRLSGNCFRFNGSGQVGAAVFSASGFGAELDNGRIDHNLFYSNNFAIRLGGGEAIEVDHNRSLLDGVFIRPAFTVALEITHNSIGEGSGTGISFFFNPAIPQANTAAEVSHNVLVDRGGHGIAADPNSLTNSLISQNRVTGSGLDGIKLAAGNSGNQVVQNRMSGNAEHDAHDDNRPANQWIKNHCDTDFPAGTICGQ